MQAQMLSSSGIMSQSTLAKSSFSGETNVFVPRTPSMKRSTRKATIEANLASAKVNPVTGKVLLKDDYAASAYLTARAKVVNESFEGALGIDDFINRVEIALYSFGFSGDNSIAMINLCRDEITAVVKEKIEGVFGSGFNTNGLGGVLTCGATGLKAGFSHSPICSGSGKERYVFFSFPHIAVDATGKVGAISRPGRPSESCACGALAASLADIKANGIANSCKIPGVHDPLDPELSILKQRLARRLRYEGTSEVDMKAMNLVDITKLAERTISDDLEYLISKAVDPAKADYAVITGVEVHNWGPDYESPSPTLEFIWPTGVYVVVNGVKTYLDITAVPTLTPRQLGIIADGTADNSNAVCENGGVGTIRSVDISWANNNVNINTAEKKAEANKFKHLILSEGLDVSAIDASFSSTWRKDISVDAPAHSGNSTKLDAETFTSYSEAEAAKVVQEELSKFAK